MHSQRRRIYFECTVTATVTALRLAAKAPLRRDPTPPPQTRIQRQHPAESSAVGPTTMEDVLRDAAARPLPPLCVFILYQLPNRDCNAKASNGEICCHARSSAESACNMGAAGDCAEGIAEYLRDVVEPTASLLAHFPQERVTHFETKRNETNSRVLVSRVTASRVPVSRARTLSFPSHSHRSRSLALNRNLAEPPKSSPNSFGATSSPLCM